MTLWLIGLAFLLASLLVWRDGDEIGGSLLFMFAAVILWQALDELIHRLKSRKDQR